MRVIVVNLLLAYIVFPLLINIGYIDNIISGNYVFYGTSYSFEEYMKLICGDLLLHCTLFLCFCLIPVYFIKKIFIVNKKQTPTALFLKGWAVLFVISLIGAIVITGGYILSNPSIPGDYFKIPLMVLFIILTLVVQCILYFFLDKNMAVKNIA